MNDVLDTEERRELPDSVFGLPERREFPMPDAAHVRAAEAYFRYCPDDLKPKLARAILKFAREYGVDVESPTVLSYADERPGNHCGPSAHTPGNSRDETIENMNFKLRIRGFAAFFSCITPGGIAHDKEK